MADTYDIAHELVGEIAGLIHEKFPYTAPDEVLALLLGVAWGFASKMGMTKQSFIERVSSLIAHVQDKADA